MNMPSVGDASLNIRQSRKPERNRQEFSLVDFNYYAPFFDVRFYRTMSNEARVNALADQADELLKTAKTKEDYDKIDALLAAQQNTGVSAADATGESFGSVARLSFDTASGGLMTADQAGPGSPLANLVNFRANLEITMTSAYNLSAVLTLTPPYEAALYILNSNLIKFGTIMAAQWGYLNQSGGEPVVSDQAYFYITQPSVKFGRETTITIGGFDIVSKAMSSAESRTVWAREGDTVCDLGILKKLVKDRAPSGFDINADGVGAKSPLRKRKKEPITQCSKDWVFFRQICRDNDVAFTQEGQVIKLYDESGIDKAEKKYNLLWYKKPSSKYDIPMISFETNPILDYFAPEGSRGQKIVSVDPDTGEVTYEERDPGSTGVTQVGEKVTDAQHSGHSTEGIKTDSGDIPLHGAVPEPNKEGSANEERAGRIGSQAAGMPNAKEKVDRANREIRRYGNMQAKAVMPGVPGMVPLKIVDVQNVPNFALGYYRVMRATHTIGLSGYTVAVDLLRASSSGIKDGTAASKDPSSNTSKNGTSGGPYDPTGGLLPMSSSESVTAVAEGDTPSTTGGTQCAADTTATDGAALKVSQAGADAIAQLRNVRFF